MKVFCVSYDLVGKKKDYDSVNIIFEKIKGKHILGSVWILKSKDTVTTCEDVFKILLKRLDKYDIELYVAEVIDSYDNINVQ